MQLKTGGLNFKSVFFSIHEGKQNELQKNKKNKKQQEYFMKAVTAAGTRIE